MTNKINKEGLDLIKEFEGFQAKPYLCPVGIPTIGYGSTYYPNGKKVTLKDAPITLEEGEELLLKTLETYINGVSNAVVTKLNSNQFSALVSFAFNCGLGALRSSTLLKKVNKNPNDLTIAHEFAKWNKGTINGKKVELKGLTRRRKAESELYYKL